MAEGRVAVCSRPRVGEGVEQLCASEDEGRADDQSSRLDISEKSPDDGIGALVFQPASGDAFVDYVGLLKEELPGRNRCTDDSNDGQQRCRVQPSQHTGNESVMYDWPD